MTIEKDNTPTVSEVDDLPTPSELDVLREQCKVMGLKYSNNSGVDSLRQKIQEKLAEGDAPEEEEEEEGDASVDLQKANPLVGVNKPIKRKTLRQHLYDENMKLVRLRITCMDPKKADLRGEFFTVSNEYLGTVRKFVPFGEQTDGGYYVPYCIYKMMEARKYLQVISRTDKNTKQIVIDQRWVREFSLEVLDNNTRDELDRLAMEQNASGRLND